MEKPIRIAANDKMRTFNEKVRNGLEHALNFMLGTEGESKITFNTFEPFLMPIESYIAAYKKKSILVKIFVEKAYVGEVYWFFEFQSAVVLGGMLRMLPAPALAEKVAKGEFDATDQDAFGEVGNQLSGILDRAFRTLTRKNIHLRMDFNKKVYPDETIKLETFLNREEYVVLLSEVNIPSQCKQKLTLLLPRSLYEVLLNLEIELQGISRKILLVNSWDEERVAQVQSMMNSRYTKVIAVDKPEDMLERIATPNLAAIAIDMKELTFPLPHSESLLFKRFLANRNFMRIPLFLSWENPSAEGLKELQKAGMSGATTQSLLKDFSNWAQPFIR